MKRRDFLKIAAGSIAVGTVSQSSCATQSNKMPNIVMIVAHDLGQHLGCYGVETVNSDNIDRLAEKGVRFENFYSTSAVCTPGRASLLTGRYPQSNGLMGLSHSPWWWRLNKDEKHVAQYLKEAGYETYLVGFQHLGEKSDRLGYGEHLSKKCKAVETTKAFSELIKGKTAGDKPFFVKAGFKEVHRPFTNGVDVEKGLFVPGWLKDTPTMRNDLAMYQGHIKYFDERVGEIVDAVEKSDVADNTIIMLTSDHGIPYPGAKWCVRKAGFEVPFIAYLPGSVFSGGKVYKEVISNVDVLPTMLDYLGLPIPKKVEGVSLKPFLEGETAAPRKEAFAQYTPDMKRDNLSRCVITKKYHLIRYFDQGRAVAYPTDVDPVVFAAHRERCATKGTRPFFQLYDIVNDPFELNDLSSNKEFADIAKELSGRLLEWMEKVDDPLLKGPLRTPYYDKAVEDLNNSVN